MKDNQEFVKCSIGIKVGGKPAEINVDVPAGKVKPQRVLPVLQNMTNSFVSGHVEKVEKEGKEISCKAGCGACCRQLVPISKIEAYNLAKIVRNLPALEKRKITRRFETALEKLRSSGWIDKIRDVADLSFDERQVLGNEYFLHGIPCPLLENGSCSIYRDRPLVCREYLVTSPARNCENPSAETIDLVPVQPKLSVIINKLSEEIIGNGEPGYLPLVSALEWTEKHPDRLPMKPGREWVEHLMEKLNKSGADGESGNGS